MKMKKMSLKLRIFLFFVTILFLLSAAHIFTVHRSITRFTSRQLDEDYHSILSEACDTMQNLLWNLTLTSGQILDNPDIQELVMQYQASPNPYQRQKYYSTLLDTISLLTMSNTDIALMYLYDPQSKDYIYSSLPVNEQPETTPSLYQNSAFTFQGPCKSQSHFIGNPVLILNRTETLPNGREITFSAESGYYSLDLPLRSIERKSAFLAVTNQNGDLIYTTLPDQSDIPAILFADGNSEYFSMSKTMSQNWTVHLLIPHSIYTRDYYSSIQDLLVCTILLALLLAIAAICFWRSIYNPLQIFDHQLSAVLSDEIQTEMHSSIPEYDYLLQKIALLKKQIQEMIQKIIWQEQQKTTIELEKLRSQINPHFLLNTLNTIHWMALINKQNEIDDVTQALAHLLSYNLDRDSRQTDIGRELNALQEYVRLQRVRYSFHFSIVLPESTENSCPGLFYPCPKFLLQPLVENSLSHGYRENMDINVSIQIQDKIEIIVSDTGTGMDRETLQKLNDLPKQTVPLPDKESEHTRNDASRFGIGLHYVVQSLHSFYNGDYAFSVSSQTDSGTIISICFPKLKGRGYHAENTDCR